MSTTVPQNIGKYTITGVLGQGAMGVVYKGYDPLIQRTVAIKTVLKSLLGNDALHDSIAARFRNEAQAVGRLQHPGVVAIYDYGEEGASAYIAMEFVEGANLEDALAGQPVPPVAQTLRLMDQLLDALDCAHAHGVWHRDVKPANLILARSGQLKLTDFGIARIEHRGLTQVASTIGTPGYMAPEQYMGEGVDHRSDLFSCGVLLYRLLTGTAPFRGSAETIMYKIMNEHPRPPSEVSPSTCPPPFDEVVQRALAKASAARFQSAKEFRWALRQIAGAEHIAHGSGADDATIIAPQGLPVVRPAAASTGDFAGTPTRWDGPQLGRIERALASHVGPMARLMVRQAAQRCPDMASLVAEVAQHIAQEGPRQRFIGEATAGSQASAYAPTVRVAALTPAPTPAPGSAAEPLSEATRNQAQALLARHLGPIARVVVKRAADQARGRAQFIELLVASAGEVDKQALLKELQQLP